MPSPILSQTAASRMKIEDKRDASSSGSEDEAVGKYTSFSFAFVTSHLENCEVVQIGRNVSWEHLAIGNIFVILTAL